MFLSLLATREENYNHLGIENVSNVKDDFAYDIL